MIRTTARAAAAPARKTRGPLTRAARVDGWRPNAALRRDMKLYPYCLEVVVPLASVGRDGYPTEREAQRLAKIEEMVLAYIAGRAVLVGHLTSPLWHDHRLVFYTDSPDWTASLRSELRAATGVGALRVNCDPDPHWYEYSHLRVRGPESRKQVIVAWLCLVALLSSYGAVQAAYHGAWGAGEVAVLVILVATRWRARKSLRQSPTRPALTFGTAAVALSAIVFPVLALARVPAWIGLIISLLAGPALAAGGWAARLTYRRWRLARLAQTASGNHKAPGQRR